jgi:hypothetical protein
VFFIPRSGIGGQFFVGKLATHFINHFVFFGELRMSCDGSKGGTSCTREGTCSSKAREHHHGWYGMVWYGMVWYGMVYGMIIKRRKDGYKK